jgi:D-glycero-alpha-D-manno-heptose-7-phosphate kinase
MAVAVTAAFSAWCGRPLSDEALLTVAMNVEAQVLGVPTGVQDYRPALYGGVSAIELGVTGAHRQPLSVDPVDLEHRLVLAYTGASRNSGINNWDVMVRRVNGDARITQAFDAIRDAAVSLRAALEERNWTGVAESMAAEWAARKNLAPGVTTPEINALLERANAAGALAGKVCGAGGGGCLVAFVEPSRKAAVETAFDEAGARVLPSSISREGLLLQRQ